MAASEKSSSPPLPSNRTDRQVKSKRNRRILACAYCRDKKVRCDRDQPTCGRCRQGRRICHYTPTPFLDESLARQLFGISYSLGFANVYPRNDSPYDIPSHGSESSMFLPNEATTPASDEHTARFENLATYTAPTPSLSRQFELSPRLSYQSPTNHIELSPVAATTIHKHSDTLLYQPLAPKIQFHSSSAAISVLYSTPIILKEVRRTPVPYRDHLHLAICLCCT